MKGIHYDMILLVTPMIPWIYQLNPMKDILNSTHFNLKNNNEMTRYTPFLQIAATELVFRRCESWRYNTIPAYYKWIMQ